MQYKKLTQLEYNQLSQQEKLDLQQKIQEVLCSVDATEIEINLEESALLVLCIDKEHLSGFIDIIADDNYSSSCGKRQMYVNYIAVHKDFQRKHIAHDLYSLAVLELQKSGEDSLRAILFSEFSRRAFENVANLNNLSLTESSFDGSEIIELRK